MQPPPPPLPPEASTPVRVAVMAKAPVPGLAKTRLAPALGWAGAARLAERLLDHAVAQAVAARLGPVTVWATPDTGHPAFVRQRQQHGVALAEQGGGDIGQRMARVFAVSFAEDCAPVLLMGSDLPAITAATLQAAASLLASHDAVLVPALDGGYGLIGLRTFNALTLSALFDGMAWSTPQVMNDTRQRLASAGLRHAELPAVNDIDEPADLVHLPAEWLAALVGGVAVARRKV